MEYFYAFHAPFKLPEKSDIEFHALKISDRTAEVGITAAFDGIFD